MFDQSAKSAKKKKKNFTYENPYEAFKDILGGIKDQALEQGMKGVNEATHELVNKEFIKMEKSGDLKPNQELNVADLEKKGKQVEKHTETIRPGIDYVGEILRSNEHASAKENQEIKQEIQNLILEIKSLAGTTSALEKQVVEATGATVVNPGKYHKSFFKWVISIIKDARTKIDNANVWLSTMKGKQKKGLMGGKQKKSSNYWDMAAQQGTQFMLSGERSVSTQTG